MARRRRATGEIRFKGGVAREVNRAMARKAVPKRSSRRHSSSKVEDILSHRMMDRHHVDPWNY